MSNYHIQLYLELGGGGGGGVLLEHSFIDMKNPFLLYV